MSKPKPPKGISMDCLMVEMRTQKPPANLEDFTGRPFGDLVVLGYGSRECFAYGSQHFWIVQCSCGHIWRVATGALRHGGTQRCLDCAGKRRFITNRTHGKSNTPEYRIWAGLCQRCNNPLSSGYLHYGARGIGVCRRWRDSFINFLDDMGPRPSPGHSIHRIDNDGPYSPGNCRWATRERQAGNKRHATGPPRMFTVAGKTQSMAGWARDLGISRERVRQRLLLCPPEVALTWPKGQRIDHQLSHSY